MRIIKYELKKLFNYRAFVFILIACLIMGIISSLNSIYNNGRNPKEYKAFFTYIRSLNKLQIEEYIADSLDDSFSGKGKYSLGTIYPLSEQYKLINQYPDYLKSIEEQCKSISGISIFADKDSFAYRNAQKTQNAYNSIKKKKLPFDISEGIEMVLLNAISDILMVFLIFVSSIFVFTKDREVGMMNLLYSYPNGRAMLCISKLTVLFVSSLIISGLFLISGLILGSITYGLGDLSRPIQSVNGFIESNVNMTVYQYVIVHFAFKSISLFIWGLFFSFICLISQNSIQIYTFSSLIVFFEFKLFSKYDIHSSKGFLHDINLLSFVKPENFFCTYRNLNINENPVSLISTTIIVGVLLVCSIIPLAVVVFSKKKKNEFKRISFVRFRRKKRKIHSKSFYAFKKLFLLQKSFYIFIIWIIVILGFHASFSKPASIVDMYYKAYTTENSGIVNAETEDVILENEKYFTGIEKKALSGNMTMSERRDYENEKNRQEAFELFKSRCYNIRDSKYNTKIFYDTGYKRAFGVTNLHEIQTMTLLVFILCVLIISPMISSDNNLKMTNIIFSTTSGKKAYLKSNSIIAASVCSIASSFTYIPYFCNIIKYYGNQGIQSPIQSITAYSNFPLPLEIWQFALLFFVLITSGYILSGQLMLIISYNCKSRYTSVIINTTIFLLPLIIFFY